MLSALCVRRTCRIAQLGSALHATKGPSTTLKITSFSRALSRTPKESLIGKDVQNKKDVNKDFKIIYKFPHILLARGICRLKIYQTAITLVALPVVGYFTHVGTLEPQALISTLSISGLAFFMLCVMGEIFRKIVGHIYYNSAKDLVKISHLTFWGGRRDIVVPTEDFVPFLDATENPSDVYVRILRYSEPKNSLFMCLKFGGIKDFDSFSHVFGDIQQYKTKFEKRSE